VQDGGKANDQPYAFNLQTYTAAAWYHKKLAPDLERKSLPDLVKEVQAWVYGRILAALMRGASLPAQRREQLVSKLQRYTGLSASYLRDTNLRINDYYWYKELLRSEHFIVGRFDSRLRASIVSGTPTP